MAAIARTGQLQHRRETGRAARVEARQRVERPRPTIPLRHLRPDHLERLYAALLDEGRADGNGGLNSKTVAEIHMIVRRALDDAVRRGWILTNPAKVAHAPKRRPLSSHMSRVWNAQQLGAFLASTIDHRCHAAF